MDFPRLALSSKAVLRIVLAILFVVAGAMHFLKPHVYEQIMPAWMPWHSFLINVSGAAEILGGIALSAPMPVARKAAFGLIVLLILVFPVNINMAFSADQFKQIPALMLWARLPLQFVLIFLLFWCTAPARSPKVASLTD